MSFIRKTLLKLMPTAGAAAYWETRHQKFGHNLAGVGHKGRSDETNEEEYRIKLQRVPAALAQELGDLRGKAVLDAGCGIGMLSAALVETGCTVTGVDVSETAVKLARERVPGATFAVSFLHDVNYGPVFDGVVCMDVLFHVLSDKDWRAALAQLLAALKPGGVLIVQESFVPGGRDAAHVRHRTLAMYEEAFGRLGARITGITDYKFTPDQDVPKSILVVRRPV